MPGKQKPSPASTKRKLLVIANGIAAVFMFTSWVGQNIYQSEMSDDMSDIERNVQFVNSEMTKAQISVNEFQNEIRKEKPDPEVIWNSALNYDEVTGTIVEAASQVDPTSAVLKKHLEDHKKFDQVIRGEARNADVEGLEVAAKAMMAWFPGIGPAAHEAMNGRAEKVRDGEERGKWIFRAFFILASLVLAGTWWKTNIDSLRVG